MRIELERAVAIRGRSSDFAVYGTDVALCAPVAWPGCAWFQGSRRGLANVT
jgi:hypothetical protein